MPLLPRKNLYEKYGDPYRVAEFRVFSFNTCGAGCKNCFYLKSNNNFSDFDQVSSLASELLQRGYTLETCYLLPTDVFENEFNYAVFSQPDFVAAIEHFNYIGLATTLRRGFDSKVLERVLGLKGGALKIEMHVNLREDLLGESSYLDTLAASIRDIKHRYGDRILVNLALNLGTPLRPDELEVVKAIVAELSDDKILELNFTFMFNPNIPRETKVRYLRNAYDTLAYFNREFDKSEAAYNQRTLLRKPSFTFKDGRILLSPIIPFDEYVYLEDGFCELAAPTFDAFLETYARFEERNTPIIEHCAQCEFSPLCQGKHFWTLANELRIPCLKGYEDQGAVV